MMYPTFGAAFLPVDGAKVYHLSDIKVKNITPDDVIQVLNGGDMMVLDGWFSYFGEEFAEGEESLVGWYDLQLGPVGDPDAKCDDREISVGQGFLGEIISGITPEFTFAGEAPTVPTSINTDGVIYPMVASYIPRAIPLNWIVPAGITPDDEIQKLNGDNIMDLDGWFAYFGEEFADGEDSLVGWYDLMKGPVGDPDAKVGDDVLVQPGDAFLGNVWSEADVEFQFPSSLKTLD